MVGGVFFSGVAWADEPTRVEPAKYPAPAYSSKSTWEADELWRQAMALQDQGRLVRAVQSYKLALVADPGCIKIYPYLGGAQYANGEYSDALESYEHYLLYEPNDSVVIFNKAATLYQLGYYQLAQVQARRVALELSSQWRYYNLLGCIALKLGQGTEAVEAFKQAQQMEPESAVLGSNLAIAYLANKQLPEARALLNSLLVEHPKDPIIKNNLGCALFADGQRPAANKIFAENSNQPESQYNLVAMSVAAKGSDAIMAAAELADSYAQEPQMRFLYGVALYRAQRWAEAYDELESLLKLEPDLVEARQYLALCLYAMQRYGESSAIWQEQVAKYPNLAWLHHNYSLSLRGNDKAYEQAKLANDLEPNRAAIVLNYANLADVHGEPREALNAYRHYLELATKVPEAAAVRERVAELEAHLSKNGQ